MIQCPYCKHSEWSDFLRIKETGSEDTRGDNRTIIILGCPKCKGIFFEYMNIYYKLLRLKKSE